MTTTWELLLNSSEWTNPEMLVAISGVIISIYALCQARRSNTTAREANMISRDANRVAERALELQEDEGRVRLVVKPRMLCMQSEDEDNRPRPFIEVINLSTFPVTVQQIRWKSNDPEKPWYYWKNPLISSPFGQLPARIPPREALTAMGGPDSIKSLDDLKAITAAVVVTACGERVEGMTSDWREDIQAIIESTSRESNRDS